VKVSNCAWFDEPPPRDKYIATLRGLVDFRGRNWLTLTPLTQPWIYDEVYTKSDGKHIHCVTVDMRDNLANLPEDAIEEFERNLTEEEKEARIHGKFMHLSGLVYKEFDAAKHVIEPPYIKDHWTRYFCIDPHDRTPTACLWFAVDENDNHYIYDELWLESMNIEQVANMIHAQEGELKARIRFIDPAMDKDNELAGGFNTRRELARHGVFCERASTDPVLGKSRVRGALRPKFAISSGAPVPQLHVSRNCPHTIYEFQHYLWSERKGSRDDMDPSQKTQKKNDHFMDCLKYIYNADPRYIQPDHDDDEEVVYEGEYVKYPTKRTVSGSGYHNLVEKGAGKF